VAINKEKSFTLGLWHVDTTEEKSSPLQAWHVARACVSQKETNLEITLDKGFTFLPFLCTFDSTQCGIYVLNAFGRLGISFCGFYWHGITPIDGVFCFYAIAAFFIQLKLLNLSFDVEITFGEFEVRVFDFVFVIPVLKSLCAPFPMSS